MKGSKPCRVDPTMKAVKIEGRNVSIEVDPGSSLSVMQFAQFKKLFPKLELKPCKVCFSMYNQTKSRAKGIAMVEVEDKGRLNCLPFYVIEVSDNPLLGRNWLKALKPKVYQELCIKKIVPEVETVKQLKKQFADVFKKEVATLKGIKASLNVDANATHKFMTARPKPFAKKLDVQKRLEEME